jgi:CDP-diacylglycerol--serine O-phosphatidyltransferase
MITLLSLCAGLTAIRLALEGRIEWALGAIVFAAVLDGVDGRVARLLKGQSKFGAELDSLADFVNFGVVPGLILYFWGLNELGAIGWIAALVFAICMSLRLARFNVMADDPNRPAWAGNFFTGVPAPAGAIIVLLPIYVNLLGMPRLTTLACATRWRCAPAGIDLAGPVRKEARTRSRPTLPPVFLLVAVRGAAGQLSMVRAHGRARSPISAHCRSADVLSPVSAQGRRSRGGEGVPRRCQPSAGGGARACRSWSDR